MEKYRLESCLEIGCLFVKERAGSSKDDRQRGDGTVDVV
jgi:hypothetical protein